MWAGVKKRRILACKNGKTDEDKFSDGGKMGNVCFALVKKGLQENKKIFREDSALDMKRQILASHQSETRQ